MNWLLIDRIWTRALHIICASVTIVLGFAAHSIILGYTSNDADDDVPNNKDRYYCLGYESDFEEFLDEFYD